MSISLGWTEIAIRLAFTIVAGGMIGFNRDEHGRPAGLRTTLLVAIAVAAAMIQANLLLATRGKVADGFVNLDVMRLPLGILSGIGFIGGGVILKRGDLIQGVTTAATLWFVTVLGLCFGGGQIALGTVAMVLGLIVLWGLEGLEKKIPQERLSALLVKLDKDGPDEKTFLASINSNGFRVVAFGMSYDRHHDEREYQCEVLWRGHRGEIVHPPFLDTLTHIPGVSVVRWNHDDPCSQRSA